jgi:hypothetical protein
MKNRPSFSHLNLSIRLPSGTILTFIPVSSSSGRAQAIFTASPMPVDETTAILSGHWNPAGVGAGAVSLQLDMKIAGISNIMAAATSKFECLFISPPHFISIFLIGQ